MYEFSVYEGRFPHGSSDGNTSQSTTLLNHLNATKSCRTLPKVPKTPTPP
jgi:hypothetical protein